MEAFRIEQKDNSFFVTFSGEITLEITTELKREIEATLQSATYENLVADLANITFMDSSGIGFLVAMNTKLMGLSKKMYLYRPSSQVSKTLELVQLHSFFNILENEDELLAVLPG